MGKPRTKGNYDGENGTEERIIEEEVKAYKKKKKKNKKDKGEKTTAQEYHNRENCKKPTAEGADDLRWEQLRNRGVGSKQGLQRVHQT